MRPPRITPPGPRRPQSRPPRRRPERGVIAPITALAGVALAVAFLAGVELGARALIGEEGKRDELAELVGSGPEARRALGRVVEADDERYVAPLIELLRGAQIGVLEAIDERRAARALAALSGERFGTDWAAWVRWYAGTDLEPPPGFTSWKGELFGHFDTHFARFFDDEAPAAIRVEEIVWGGVRVDGIPALDRPVNVPARRARYLDPSDPVFGVEVGGEARAYPQRIVDWHEMVNDVVGGVHVSLAYCTLCGAGILYETETPERTYTFGSSGLLMRSNKLMYDRETGTLWNQLTGDPVLGPAVDDGVELAVRPLVVTTWRRWRSEHPDTQVLDDFTGYGRSYERGAAYGDYFAAEEPLFPVASPGRGLRPKERLFALRAGDAAKAYRVEDVLAERTIEDRVGERDVLVIAAGEAISTRGRDTSADGSGRPVAYDSGAELRAYERGGHTFTLAAPGRDGRLGAVLRDEVGARWRLREDALVGPRGQRLGRLGGHLAYAFAWISYFPETDVYRPATGAER